ncbi:MAG: hypothetical protein M1828_004408 [Chrysothrix sp. TS-e1954]|nr:MAG: hypothetical protein M1828_004408 [Chrysothrix sp. TS-e1954]
MSYLRRRLQGEAAVAPSRTPSPVRPTSQEPSSPDGAGEDSSASVNIPIAKLNELNAHLKRPQKGSKRRIAWIFGLGGLFGILVALYFAGNNEMIDLAMLKDMNFESLMDVLPASFISDAQELQRHERDAVAYDSFSVGLHAQSQGIQATNPVIMIPGVISTGLESWGTMENSRQYFRKRLWGSWSMMRALVLDKASWKHHIMLDKHTGLDPPGIKLRAAQGFDATDFFITGYWIWNKILENLATIGYDPSNAFTAAYDWRLSYSNLEVRDQYFARLKSHVETARHIQNKKVVLLSHSMGSQVLYYFFHWVESNGEGHGHGGSSWVENHIDSWINISGCMLGTAKGIPAVLSGEMKDTAQLNAVAVYGLEKFLSRHERAEIFRAMPGISSMLPIGGDAVWGDAEHGAPDDVPGQNTTFGRFITFRNSTSSTKVRGGNDAIPHVKNLTVGDTLPYLLEHSEPWYRTLVSGNYSHGVAHSREEVEANQEDPRRWINPLETRLPLAPSLKIYCFYGTGKPTERAYFYRPDSDPLTKTNVTIDTAYSVYEQAIDHGVVMGEGDGTVNLLSTGYMCTHGWHIDRYNPAGVEIKTVEMKHEPDRFSPRGGPNTGDHVDILGRSSLNDLILRVAGGKGEQIEEVITSNIKEYAKKVRIWHDE